MMLILIILVIAGLSIAIIEIAKRVQPDINLAWLPFLASLPVPGLSVLYWLFNLWWLQSDNCLDMQNCGRAAMMSMSVGAAVGFFGSFFIGMTISILWINWRRKK
ncbi:hypothetical protein [Sphingorhabdus sp. 109]|jgi:hypothetical protein|uniref:hypothetical protein n=1 Tax=Sphingorhabdus sp. 109 TaxID=2653173 RepID=UPI0012F2F94D|nr:hypothetical protein [Sphingorhabdus sp. 109]VWX57103.1 conserved membrane hypothetical protein [Sphingorhabdus sp. 109]